MNFNKKKKWFFKIVKNFVYYLEFLVIKIKNLF